MAGQRISGKTEMDDDVVTSYGQATSVLTTLLRTLLHYQSIELGLGSCTTTAMAARWCMALRRDGKPAILAPNQPNWRLIRDSGAYQDLVACVGETGATQARLPMVRADVVT